MYPLASPHTVDLLDELLHSEEGDWDTVASRLPALFGSSDKATYLCYRSLGLSPTMALIAVECKEEELAEWLQDPEFAEIERKRIFDLQDRVAADMIKLGFMKNMALFIAKDASIISKAMYSPELLTKREHDYYLSVRKHYTPSDLLALDKVLNPGSHNEQVNVILSFGNQEQHVIEGVHAPYVLEGQVTDHDSPEIRHAGDPASE